MDYDMFCSQAINNIEDKYSAEFISALDSFVNSAALAVVGVIKTFPKTELNSNKMIAEFIKEQFAVPMRFLTHVSTNKKAYMESGLSIESYPELCNLVMEQHDVRVQFTVFDDGLEYTGTLILSEDMDNQFSVLLWDHIAINNDFIDDPVLDIIL